MRIRSVKPEFWADEVLSTLPAETLLLLLGLNNYADDEGYFNANPRLIQCQLFPLRDLSRSIPCMLTELSVSHHIELRTAADGRVFGRIVRFGTEQVVNRATKGNVRPLFEACSAPSVNGHGALSESSLTTHPGTGNREQGTGNREEGAGRTAKRGGVVVKKKPGGSLPAEQPEPVCTRMLAICELKDRMPSTHWSAKEIEAFKAAGLALSSDEAWRAEYLPMAAYYGATLGVLRDFWSVAKPTGREDFRRRDLLTLLNNWGTEVDRARQFTRWQEKKRVDEGAGRL